MRQDLVEWIRTVSQTNDIDWICNNLKETGYIEHQYLDELKEVFGMEVVNEYLNKSLIPLVSLSEYPDFKLNNNNYIAIEGRICYVLFESTLPRILMINNFLSNSECDSLIEMSKPKIKRSLVISRNEDKSELHDSRTSSGTYFSKDELPLLTEIDQRIESLTNWPKSRQETMQILNYKPGEEYKPHNDYFDLGSVATPKILERGGQRLATMIIYLNNCPEGGDTIFPESGIKVKPQKGCAVFFSYPTHDKQSKTLHGGSPVVSGEKWIAVKWFRERDFI